MVRFAEDTYAAGPTGSRAPLRLLEPPWTHSPSAGATLARLRRLVLLRHAPPLARNPGGLVPCLFIERQSRPRPTDAADRYGFAAARSLPEHRAAGETRAGGVAGQRR
jgi:hypothetical protein